MNISKIQTAGKEKKRSYFSIIFRRLIKKPKAVVGFVILLIIVLMVVFAEFIMPYAYDAIDTAHRMQPPNAEHIFGTDSFGRDVFSRLLYGGRYSLMIGISTVALSLAVGIVLGAIAGFYGGVVDQLIMRALDIVQAIPGMLLAVCISSVLGPGIVQCIVALAISSVAEYARLLRANIMSVRNAEYIEAAQVIKCSRFRTIFIHILPNSISPLIVQATMSVAGAIISASALSFIGLGVQPPVPEWGAMLSESRSVIRESPYLTIFPGLVIMITVLAINMIGDCLRDALDPKLKK